MLPDIFSRIKHGLKIDIAEPSISSGYVVDVKMFYFTCNHGLRLTL